MVNMSLEGRVSTLEGLVRRALTRIGESTDAVTSVFGRTGAVTAASNDYTEAQISFSDITTNDASVSKHGYLKKLPNETNYFINGDGTWGPVDENRITMTDVTTLNASTSQHGFLKKLSNVSTEFMNGQGNWATPASGAFTEIASTTTASSATEVTFSSLSAARYFLLFVRAKGDAAGNQYALRFNADTGNNYTYDRGFPAGNTWAGSVAANQAQLLLCAKSNDSFQTFMVLIDGGGGGVSMTPTMYEATEMNFATGFWQTQTTITSITILCTGGNFVDGSIMTLVALT